MSELHFRALVLNLLTRISKLDDHTGPVELLCEWFDDLYLPGHSWKHALDRDAWNRGLREWEACFSASELEALATFHGVYNSLSDELPIDPRTFAQDKNWHRVAAAARVALERFDQQ